MSARALSLCLALLGAVSACSHGTAGSATAQTAQDSPAPSSTAVTVPAPPSTTACTDRKAGKDGVTKLFCDGSASLDISAGARVATLQGGSCSESKGVITVNAGVAVGTGWAGSSVPDYVSVDVPDAGGEVGRFVAWIGNQHLEMGPVRASVSVNKKRIHVSGFTARGVSVTVDIAC
ncbi:MAG: hypothetical protein JWL70_869 [Acidimicrobiia bacterium]|nr:hypothetical protein [Acidimicrobiia bacterium]